MKSFKAFYEKRGYLVKICPKCKKLTQFHCPKRVKAVDGPSISSGMFCNCEKKRD